jgi:Type II secretion system (T2SS), protein M subtype b
MTRFGSKLLALLMLLLVLTPVTFVALKIWEVLREQPVSQAAAQDQLQRLEAAASTVPSPQERDVIRIFSGRTLLGKGPPAVLAAAMQERLRNIAKQHGITILRASEIVAEPLPILSKVGLKLDMSGPALAILAFAEDIERLEPWLRVEAAALRSGFIDTSPQQVEPLMTASFEIWGWASSGDSAR